MNADPQGPALVAIILAAGASTRMGQPKALLRWGARTFLSACVDAAAHVCGQSIVVVDGAVDLKSQALALGVAHTHNAHWPQGPLSSLQCGLAVAGPGAVLVMSVDRPHVSHATVSALHDASAAEPSAIWQPAFQGRRGHPIIWPAHLRPALAALAPTQSPRELLAEPQCARLRRSVDVHDPAVLDNLDRPEDLARLPDR